VRGVDCAGPIVNIAQAIGFVFEDPKKYPKAAAAYHIRQIFDSLFEKIEAEEIKPGDLLIIRWGEGEDHIAIVGDYCFGGLSMIHCHIRAKKVVENRLAGAWRAKIAQAYKIPGVAEDM
jgi:hypothetical protein